MNKTKKRLPNWAIYSIIGIDMIIVGAVIWWLYPTEPEDPFALVPLALIGLGMLLFFVSLISLRGIENRKDQSK
jgi:hypothetical protein